MEGPSCSTSSSGARCSPQVPPSPFSVPPVPRTSPPRDQTGPTWRRPRTRSPCSPSPPSGRLAADAADLRRRGRRGRRRGPRGARRRRRRRPGARRRAGRRAGPGRAPPPGRPRAGLPRRAGATRAVAARLLVADKGWSSEQFSCLDRLWTKESNWRWNADNPLERVRHPAGAARLEDGLVRRRLEDQPGHPDQVGPELHRGRYGTPCSAWSHSQPATGTEAPAPLTGRAQVRASRRRAPLGPGRAHLPAAVPLWP